VPTQTTVNETYWAVCWKWIFPYPCKKTRTVTKWCYDFSVVHETCRVFSATLYGCERGREYKWTSGCFGWFDAYYTNKHLCFSKPLDDTGSCQEGYSIPRGGTIPAGVSRGSSALRTTGSTSTLVAAIMVISTQVNVIQSYLEESGSVPTALLPHISLLGCGVLILLATFLTITKRCSIGGVIVILSAILAVIFALLSFSLNWILVIGIMLALLGGILSVIGSAGPCQPK